MENNRIQILKEILLDLHQGVFKSASINTSGEYLPLKSL